MLNSSADNETCCQAALELAEEDEAEGKEVIFLAYLLLLLK